MTKSQSKHLNKRAYYSAFLRLAPSFCALVRKNLRNNLQSAVKIGTLSPQSQKTTAEPENSNFLLVAQNTPNACFFMRSIRTPQKRRARLSMVACSGKGSALCCVPQVAVSQPVTRYRQSLRNLAVTLENLSCGVTQMYQFIFALMRTPTQFLKIRILADNEQQARARFTDGDSLLFIGRINLHRQNMAKINRTFDTMQGGVYA